MAWLTVTEYMCHKWPRICSTCRKHFPVLSSFMTYNGFVTRVTWRVPLVEQKQLSLPEYLSSFPVFSGVLVTWSVVLCVLFVDRCLSFRPLSFGHCVVCPSIYEFWLPLWYIQTLLWSKVRLTWQLVIKMAFYIPTHGNELCGLTIWIITGTKYYKHYSVSLSIKLEYISF